MDLVTQKQHVESLYATLRKQQAEIELTKDHIQKEVSKLQAMCGKHGHVFSRYSDEDYHRPSYYYLCSTCQYYTNRPPRKND